MKDGLSLIGAAEFVYMSPAYLSRVSKEEIGENYNNYVTRKRVKIAKRLLLEMSHMWVRFYLYMVRIIQYLLYRR